MRSTRITRTYSFKTETVERIALHAKRIGCYPGPLVELLLNRAIDEVESGGWTIGRKPVVFEVGWEDQEDQIIDNSQVKHR